jgi:hypothetical protein
MTTVQGMHRGLNTTTGLVVARGLRAESRGTSEGSLLEQGLVLALLRGVKGVQPQGASLGFSPRLGSSGYGARLESGFGEKNGSWSVDQTNKSSRNYIIHAINHRRGDKWISQLSYWILLACFSKAPSPGILSLSCSIILADFRDLN